MAAARDLLPRATALGATCIYQGQPAGWLRKAAKAAPAAPVVVNCKGIDADSTPVLVTLAELERLHQAARQVEHLQVLMPDKLGIAADGNE